MKTAREIQFDFRNAINQAEELEDIAERLKNLAKKNLGEIEQTIPSYWEGPSARQFQGKTSQMKENLLRTAKSLEREASTIRAIAEKIYRAEMDALALARRRAAAAAAARSAGNFSSGGGNGGGGGGGGGF